MLPRAQRDQSPTIRVPRPYISPTEYQHSSNTMSPTEYQSGSITDTLTCSMHSHRHMLCFFSGEEQGLLGSRAYAKHLADQGADVVAMFNADMLGYKLPGTEVTLGMKDRYISDWLLEASNGYSTTYVPGIKVCAYHRSLARGRTVLFWTISSVLTKSDCGHLYSYISRYPPCGIGAIVTYSDPIMWVVRHRWDRRPVAAPIIKASRRMGSPP